MAQQINPAQHSVESCLSKRTYAIDFYQRDYVWTKQTVMVLLNDIFYTFNLSYDHYKNATLTKEVLEKYSWYYMNIFITNNISGKCFIVDGQQRLTTLSLVALKLMKMTNNANLQSSLSDCIRTTDKWQGSIFNLDNEKRHDVMAALMNDRPLGRAIKNKTEKNLIERYNDISEYLVGKNMDSVYLDTFISYFLERLVLMELSIDKDDTPMVFEVINDRGEPLNPYEILKGKLIGALDKNDTDAYSLKWDNAMHRVSGMEDEFFIDYLKSHFIFTSNAKVEEAINQSYHRYIYEANNIGNALGFRKTDPGYINAIKVFLDTELEYYTKLYEKIRRNTNLYLKYSKDLLYLSGQYQVIMAACSVNDPEEDLKIDTIAQEFDRLFVLLRLNRAYDSSTFKDIYYSLNKKLAGAAVSQYAGLFDSIICDVVKKRYNLQSADVLSFNIFEATGYTNSETRFLRYYLARIEDFICRQMNLTIDNPVDYITSRTGAQTGYHIEHILSQNNTNKAYFKTNEEFESKRNQLGGLLLLKGKNNISSGNEEYVDKLKTYSAGLVWGRTLIKDYHHTNKDLENLNARLRQGGYDEIESIDTFDATALSKRNTLLYQLTKIIWDVDRKGFGVF